jgi:hypothetical protein
MPSDKERADWLLSLCESLFIRACVLQALLDESGLANWSGRLDKSLNSEQGNLLRVEFRAMCEQSLAQADQNAVLEFLMKVDAPGKIQ